MAGLLLLVVATTLYAGYNLLIKVSASHVPEAATSTVAATICLQLAALTTSVLFLSVAMIRGGQVLQLTWGAYLWAAAAGLCIGGAEITYFYLFGGIGATKPMAANVVIPTVVSGTIVLTTIAAYVIFRETLAPIQVAGIGCIILGVLLLYLGKGLTLG
jgi:drug/metabolite transporter (DMT)-like permease